MLCQHPRHMTTAHRLLLSRPLIAEEKARSKASDYAELLVPVTAGEQARGSFLGITRSSG